MSELDNPPACTVCGRPEDWYCRGGELEPRPMCKGGCGEHAGGVGDGFCRDCGIQHHLDTMQCSKCERMRYRRRDGTVLDKLTAIGEALWGDRCECPEPLPPSIAETKAIAP